MASAPSGSNGPAAPTPNEAYSKRRWKQDTFVILAIDSEIKNGRLPLLKDIINKRDVTGAKFLSISLDVDTRSKFRRLANDEINTPSSLLLTPINLTRFLLKFRNRPPPTTSDTSSDAEDAEPRPRTGLQDLNINIASRRPNGDESRSEDDHRRHGSDRRRHKHTRTH